MVDFTAEHVFILVCALFFPPVLLMVWTVVVVTVFGQTLGFNRRYLNCLLKIFEWSARQIRLTACEKSQNSLNLRTETNHNRGDEGCNVEHASVKSDKRPDVPRSSRRDQHLLSGIIFRETSVHSDIVNGQQSAASSRGWAAVRDSMHLVKAGIEAVIQDDVTSRFEAEELVSWNMLARTILLPVRLTLLFTGVCFMIVSTAVIGLLPDGPKKRWLNERCLLCGYQILSGCVSAVITFNNRENRARNGGICVANHTSPIDVVILSTDCAYDLVGQRHGGLLGILQRALSRASSHIWFERSEARDRSFVAEKLKEHVSNMDLLPILIFPEGTCINNTSVMMFKKGCFEVATTIYPIAMKYDSRFGDPFWNSSQHGWFENCFRMLTSWAIICDVWYLRPMTKRPNENAIDFASRVKKEIAMCGGLVDLEWDGQLKRSRVPAKLVLHQQQKFVIQLVFLTQTVS
ncbi:unnamed protein product [Gongylonema pulchrum]|uniref:PlsC domain-containing protein n=1 Tax=Gongylonema pulchrum TaxID=637853 RepID=A0A183DR24_9BILA|nr:unnamed protein product [Gongylonema pulchrum]